MKKYVSDNAIPYSDYNVKTIAGLLGYDCYSAMCEERFVEHD